MKQTKECTKTARWGKQIIWDFYNRGKIVLYNKGIEEKLHGYEMGSNKKADRIFEEIYKSTQEIANPVPIRIRMQEYLLKLEGILR